ncbi:MAG: proline--tRNA ligase [candidate division Zixibacteria bacterium]|nr:proline--tRNA ligase [candidate division Zixibacteria bacterium]
MRWSKTYIPTLRNVSSEAELISHQYLLRSGYIRRLAAGIYSYLPLMQRVIDKVSTIVREEMDASGAIEILMPVLHPAEVWKKSGRWDKIGKELIRLKDRHGREMALGPTHEEVITSLVAGELKSYKQMPLNMYQIQTKFRDEIRPRFGLMRGREFLMKDAYSFDVDFEAHKIAYKKMVEAYFNVFNRCGVAAKKVESDTGAMGGTGAHEFMVLVETDGGEETILSCASCDYAANVEKAVFRELNPTTQDSEQKELEKVDTPNATTIEEITKFLNLPASKFAKTVIYLADGKPVAAIVRGDRQINEVKLSNHLGCLELVMAGPEKVMEITTAPVGFAGPVGLTIPIVADTEIATMVNFVTGANKADKHLLNVNINRDFKPGDTVDIKNAPVGEGCSRCENGVLEEFRGIEVGNTFSLGTKYSETLGGKYLDDKSKENPYFMGSYGIGITRTAQAAIEKYHDDKGIIWPKTIAPYQIILCPLNMTNDEQVVVADKIYADLTAAGLEVLYDDRKERAGVKFNDADLIGIPLRIALGNKSLADGKVELKLRSEADVEMTDINSVVEKSKELLQRAI